MMIGQSATRTRLNGVLVAENVMMKDEDDDWSIHTALPKAATTASATRTDGVLVAENMQLNK